MKLIIDSCSDLSLSKAEELGADVLPLTIQIEDKSYLDQLEITSEEVIQAIKDGKRPMTSQPNPDAFEKLFKKYTDQGESVIYIGFSSNLSGTFQSAVIGRDLVLEENSNADITVIDTQSASYGVGLLVERTAEYIAEGNDKDTIISKIE